jgi:hypothetical protein
VQRTINQTGRRKLERSEVSVRLVDGGGQADKFEVDFSFKAGSELPPDATVYVEAYSGNTLQRFTCGRVDAARTPDESVLDKLDPTNSPLFRVRVVDESSYIGRLLASADKLRAGGDDDQDRASLMTLASRPLGQQTWRVNVRDTDKPELVINSAIPNAMELLKSDPIFQALILPAAFKQVLLFYIWDNQFEEGSQPGKWLELAQQFAGDKPHSDDPSELLEWIDTVVERFAEKYELKEMINRKREENS